MIFVKYPVRPTGRQPALKFFSVIAMAMVIATPVFGQDGSTPEQPEAGQQVETASSTLVYGPDFFIQYPNAVTALDIIDRIPSGRQILNAANNGDSRGFSNQQDTVLINGKRLSGKMNDSRAALGRITIDQVERIEIIRGTNPDIKVSSQEAIINVIVREGNQASGSWRGLARMARDEDVAFGGFLSYGGNVGNFEYFASAEISPTNRVTNRRERLVDGNGDLVSTLEEKIIRDDTELELSANTSYAFESGHLLRLNGLFSATDSDVNFTGDLFEPAPGTGDLAFTGNSARIERLEDPEFEVGIDYEAPLSSRLDLKLLALRTQQTQEVIVAEDFLIEGPAPVDDFRFTIDSDSAETIGRASLTWLPAAGHSIEFGSEQAVNVLEVDFSLEELQEGILVEQPEAASNTRIEETRNESFLIHSWQATEKLNIDTSLFTEWSKLEQTGDAHKSRTFFFLRPSVDTRYNITDRDQVQFSVRRNVRQLDFFDFAASRSDDDEVVEGNENLVPEKNWEFEASFEHRIANDGGRVKLTLLNQQFQDRIEIIPVGGGNIARGNVGDAERWQLVLDTSIRMGFIGLPDLVIEPLGELNFTSVRDPFTGEKRNFNGWNTGFVELGMRHDINSIGLSYGGTVGYFDGWKFQDNDETIRFNGGVFSDAFVEKSLPWGLTVRFESFDLNNRLRKRDRTLFLVSRIDGVIDNTEFRRQREGRTFIFSIRGTF